MWRNAQHGYYSAVRRITPYLLALALFLGAVTWIDTWNDGAQMAGHSRASAVDEAALVQYGLEAAKLALELHEQTRDQAIRIRVLEAMSWGYSRGEAEADAQIAIELERQALERQVSEYRRAASESREPPP